MSASGRVVRVNLSPPYDITVRPGLLAGAAELLRGLSKAKKAVVVTDSTVGPLHAAALQASLQAAGFEVVVATVSAGEEHKTLATVGRIYDQILPAGIDRSTPVLALGGGVIGDMAGFVA